MDEQNEDQLQEQSVTPANEDESVPSSSEVPRAEAEEPKPEPLTAEQVEQVEQMLRQLMLAKQRNQPTVVQKILEELESIGPNHPPILEVLGDDLLARGQRRKAREMYKRALDLDPENRSAETKYAELVLFIDYSSNPDVLLQKDA